MMKSSKEMAEIWNVSERTVTTFCKSGKVPGAIKEGRTWKIPEDAKKPADGRVMSGRYVKKNIKNTIKALPIGISDYVLSLIHISTFLSDIGKLFQTALTVPEIEGIIINPWNRTIMLDKKLIRIIMPYN